MPLTAALRSSSVFQSLGQRDVRLHLDVLLVAERGHVDGVLDHAALQVLAHLHGDLHADRFLRLEGGAGNVRREQDVF